MTPNEEEMEKKLILDKSDLSILPALARDCRTSYSNISSQIGLTAKSVKARVKKMVRSGVIEKFVVRVNTAAFGYTTAVAIIKTRNGIVCERNESTSYLFPHCVHAVKNLGSHIEIMQLNLRE